MGVRTHLCGMDVLNLYAGIGGNRKHWDEVTDIDVTAIEYNETRAQIYRDHFPNDTVIVTDAHQYLLDHYHEYDFIWSSPPCPTHSQMRQLKVGPDNQNEPVYPDMDLYQEVIFLKHHFTGDWVVENVNPYYDPLIEPQEVGRHYVWSNFHIPEAPPKSMDIETANVSDYEERYGFDTSGYDMDSKTRLKSLRNVVRPELGEHIFRAATTNRQTTLI